MIDNDKCKYRLLVGSEMELSAYSTIEKRSRKNVLDIWLRYGKITASIQQIHKCIS